MYGNGVKTGMVHIILVNKKIQLDLPLEKKKSVVADVGLAMTPIVMWHTETISNHRIAVIFSVLDLLCRWSWFSDKFMFLSLIHTKDLV